MTSTTTGTTTTRTKGRIVCPKCRALGLSTDCSDRKRMEATDFEDGIYDLDVTMTFTVPVSSTLPLDPHEMAAHMRETWMDDDEQLSKVLTEATTTEFDLQVKPAFTMD